ncbi:MAG: hypothetical protein JO147_03385 [Actinobacteria bacterium]|nr:hypothetical protein [Actinomycetota bacterium]
MTGSGSVGKEVIIVEPSRPRRPSPHADLTPLIDALGGFEVESPDERAAATAQVLLRAAREGSGDPAALIGLADRIGIETLAALWRDAARESTAGGLWAMYLLRHWIRTAPVEVVELWTRGERMGGPDVVVAGVDARANADAMSAVGDAVLATALVGDFGVALDRAAAVFRVLARGRRARGEFDGGGLAWANEQTAAALAEAARRWRAGQLG